MNAKQCKPIITLGILDPPHNGALEKSTSFRSAAAESPAIARERLLSGEIEIGI
jgi:hypothetical protein